MVEQKLDFGTQSVTIIGGAQFTKFDLDDCLNFGSILIAADGGANSLKNNKYELDDKYKPAYIIGDLDSLKNLQSWERSSTKLIKIKEQQTTDFEKCLYSVNALKYICVGFIGNRSDHFLSVCTSMVKYHSKRIILVGSDDVIFHLPRIFEIDLPVNTRLSLFPMQKITGIKDTGLKWRISNIEFDPAKRVGTSNITTERKVKLQLSNHGMLMILPRACLRNVVNQFSQF